MKNRFELMREQSKKPIEVITAPLLYPTPPDLAARMVELLDVKNGAKILEPSAGTGALLRELDKSWNNLDVVAVEINFNLAQQLRTKFKASVFNEDFLEMDLTKTFDAVIMNPPFNGGADVRHVLHALKFLKSGGRLVAIVANGPRQIEKLKPLSSTWEELPAGTFKNAGTMVNTVLLSVQL